MELPKCWGTGRRAAADGSKFEIYHNNLRSEYHIRYGGYGGIAYHHVSDTYIALFNHFINCGVWEAVYILDGLLKNTSDIQPDTLHADTQGQSTLLQKLGSYSRKNRLYQAFRELGYVVRTVFLLEYISDRALRQEITACTNVVEGYHQFLDWLFFGKQGVITENDPLEQEKRIKYLDLVASAVILHNAVDLSLTIQQLSKEGVSISRQMLASLSPYLTRHLKRYGDFVIDLQTVPMPLEGAIFIPLSEIQT